MSTAWPRGAAIVLAVLAVADPVWTTQRPAPPNVHLHVVPGTPDRVVEDVRRELTRSVDGFVTFDISNPASATVVIGDRLPDDVAHGGAPVSIVSPYRRDAPNVLVTAVDPPPTLSGWSTRLPVLVQGTGLAGRSSVVVLEHQGTEIARVEHRWAEGDESFDPGFTFVPPRPGAFEFDIVVQPTESEATTAHNRAGVRLVAESRQLRVFAFEPRASWAAAFVRRALEVDPAFDVVGLAGASRGIQVRSGRSPRRLDYGEIEPFDAVLVGAPEELSGAEVDALHRFVRTRGGAVVLLPDRRPTGPYLDLLPTKTFDEILTERPRQVASQNGALRGAEFALPPQLPRGVDPVATVVVEGTERAAVFAWPAGAGQFLFSGVLDAWRGRGDGHGFAEFWRARIAAVAAASPRPITVSASPALVRAGETVSVRARLRPTALEATGDRVITPEVTARVVGPAGERWFRLWPTTEPGAFEGRFRAEGPADYDVRVTASGAGSGDTILRVRDHATRPTAGDTDVESVARATGGVAVDARDLSLLVAHLKGLPRDSRSNPMRPARSVWWVVAFVGLLCVEWGIRRRSGAS
jgi:hypothetical protein